MLSVINQSNLKTTKEMKKILVTFCLAAVMTGLSSCGSTKQAAASLADIEGEWNIVEINGAAVVPAPGQTFPYIGFDKATGRVLVEVSPDFYRPTDVVNLWGDPSKAKAELGWNPTKTSFEQLVKIMVDADMAKVAVERAGDEIRTNLAEYLEKGIVK